MQLMRSRLCYAAFPSGARRLYKLTGLCHRAGIHRATGHHLLCQFALLYDAPEQATDVDGSASPGITAAE
jgi:hypothetical protein